MVISALPKLFTSRRMQLSTWDFKGSKAMYLPRNLNQPNCIFRSHNQQLHEQKGCETAEKNEKRSFRPFRNFLLLGGCSYRHGIFRDLRQCIYQEIEINRIVYFDLTINSNMSKKGAKLLKTTKNGHFSPSETIYFPEDATIDMGF